MLGTWNLLWVTFQGSVPMKQILNTVSGPTR